MKDFAKLIKDNKADPQNPKSLPHKPEKIELKKGKNTINTYIIEKMGFEPTIQFSCIKV